MQTCLPMQSRLPIRLAQLLLLALAAHWSAGLYAGETGWPNNRQVAISLSYDDALDSQLDNAAPALRAAGLHASFYLTLSSAVVAKRLQEWRELAAQGHELGNHTLFHHCRGSLPGRDWVGPHQDLDKRSPAQLREEILTANQFLQAIDGLQQRTFTPPCGDTLAGGEDYLTLIRAEMLAIKGQEPKALNAVWLAPSEISGEALIQLVEQHAATSKLINLTFHGVGGDHLAISEKAHRQLLNFLALNSDRFYVATYREIAQKFN